MTTPPKTRDDIIMLQINRNWYNYILPLQKQFIFMHILYEISVMKLADSLKTCMLCLPLPWSLRKLNYIRAIKTF